jgi:N-acetylmuramoyl-L-alanine amidase
MTDERERTPNVSEAEPPAVASTVMRNLAVALTVSAAMATVFTAWTPASLAPEELAAQLAAGLEVDAQATPALALEQETALRIGVVAGHSGINPDLGFVDPGAVCDDGLTELEINESIADRVVSGLRAAGLEVDLLEEFDDRLVGYRGVALISLHADSCVPINADATGYKVAAAVDTAVPDRAQRLVACLADRYGEATGLRYHPESITRDMTEYHTFYEIHSQTPAVIMETGFMHLDRDFLTQHPDDAARGIAEGVLCFVNNEPIDPTSG